MTPTHLVWNLIFDPEQGHIARDPERNDPFAQKKSVSLRLTAAKGTFLQKLDALDDRIARPARGLKKLPKANGSTPSANANRERFKTQTGENGQ